MCNNYGYLGSWNEGFKITFIGFLVTFSVGVVLSVIVLIQTFESGTMLGSIDMHTNFFYSSLNVILSAIILTY